MSEILWSELMERCGLPELADISQDEMADYFMPAAVAGLADGDVAGIHLKPLDGRLADLYGQKTLNEGRVAKAIFKTAIENGMQPGPIYDFQGFAADYYSDPGSPFRPGSGIGSPIRIYPEALTVDDNPIALPRQPEAVVDYAACLTSRSYLRDQMDFVGRTRQTFVYAPLTRLHFTNRALMMNYDVQLGEGVTQAFVNNRLYIGREDGIGAATDDMIQAQEANNAPVDAVDIVLCNSAQHTTAKELRHGMRNAHRLLKEGGMLIIRSLARPAADEIGTDQIAGWAYDGGFQEGTFIQYSAVHRSLGTMILTGHYEDRDIKTLVLAK